MNDALTVKAEVIEAAEYTRRADFTRAYGRLTLASMHAPSLRWFVETVLAPLQRLLGVWWQHGDLDVATIRAASRIVGAVLDDLGRRSPTVHRSPAVVAVACVPGEWHELPARMLATLLRDDGWQTVELGPSVSPARLASEVRAIAPVAVALSATMPTTLAHTADAIHAVHRLGLPVLAGGTAFGATDRRARALGVDAWCRDADAAGRALDAWQHGAPASGGRHEQYLAAALTDSNRARIVDAAVRNLARTRSDDVVAAAGPAARMAWLLALVEGAAMTADVTVVTESVAWWRTLRLVRTMDASVVDDTVGALAAALEPGALRSVTLQAAGA